MLAYVVLHAGSALEEMEFYSNFLDADNRARELNRLLKTNAFMVDTIEIV